MRYLTCTLLTQTPVSKKLGKKSEVSSQLAKLQSKAKGGYLQTNISVEFIESHVKVTQPLHQQGSLRDAIHQVNEYWSGKDDLPCTKDWALKYRHKGEGLPLDKVVLFGRRILKVCFDFTNACIYKHTYTHYVSPHFA